MLLPHLNLFFLKKNKLASLPYFLHEFWRKVSVMVYSINWPKFIVWLFLLYEILGNICLQLFVNQAVTSEILKLTLSFSSSRFFNMTKKSRQKFKYIENKKRFWVEIKTFFITFEELSLKQIKHFCGRWVSDFKRGLNWQICSTFSLTPILLKHKISM